MGYLFEKSNADTSGIRFRTQALIDTKELGFRVDFSTDVKRYTSNILTFNKNMLINYLITIPILLEHLILQL